MTYDEALKYIHGISWTFCKPGLERTEELCKRLRNPEKSLKFIHVAGTNGKGSFSSMLSEILQSSGLKVGLYTSPYIVEFNERMKVNGRSISNSDLAELTEYVKPHAEAMKDRPTEFELITAIAFEYFKREGVDAVVLEAGMGGRLDSTNVIENPLLSVITGVALDHTAFLGDTVEKIAGEKAGIVKQGVPLLFGGEDEDAARVIKEKCQSKGSEFLRADYSELKIKEATLEGTSLDYKDFKNIKISLLGTYQPRNCALVLEAVTALRERGLSIPDEAVRGGLEGARWPARFEIISKEPLIIFDGAHNPEGISAAVESIKRYFGEKKLCAISGVLRDKDYKFVSKKLSEVIGKAFTITPDNPRALKGEEYAELLRADGVKATAEGSVGEALSKAIGYSRNTGTPIVCLGSLYTYGEVISELKKQKGEKTCLTSTQ